MLRDRLKAVPRYVAHRQAIKVANDHPLDQRQRFDFGAPRERDAFNLHEIVSTLGGLEYCVLLRSIA